MLHKKYTKYTWTGNRIFVPILATICLLNSVSAQSKVDFHGGFHLAPQFFPAGDPFTDEFGIVSVPGTVIENRSVLMMPYRIRLRAKITF